MTVTIQEAMSRLPDLLDLLRPGEELTITDGANAVARLTKTPTRTWPSPAGTAKERTLWMAPDFDAPIDDMKEHME